MSRYSLKSVESSLCRGVGAVAVVSITVGIGSFALAGGVGDGPPTCVPVEAFKFTADDGMFSDHFGYDVDVRNGRCIVGAYQDDDNGSNSGSAYVYRLDLNAELWKLTASDGVADDRFGWSVAISDTHAIVGAYRHDALGSDSGAVYVFDLSTGQQVAKIMAPDGETNDRFGFSVAVDGTDVLIGATGDDDAASSAGAAYAFDITTPSSPVFKYKVLPNAAGGTAIAGQAVAIADDYVVMGAPNDSEDVFNGGAMYVYHRANGALHMRLSGSDTSTSDSFGYSVDADGSTAVAGARKSVEGLPAAGSAFVFDLITGDELAKLTPDDPESQSEFGTSVGIAGDLVVVGRPGDDEGGVDAGAAYLFRGDGWAFESKLVAGDAEPIDDAGESVAVSAEDGGIAIVGTRRESEGGFEAGAAYRYALQCPSLCAGDLNGGDGVVDVSDLLTLLANWGGDGEGADLADPSDVVDVSDLLVLLAAWGPCE